MSANSAVHVQAKDWQSSKHIGKRSRYLLEHPDEEIPSDVSFLVGDGQREPQKLFKCHKFLLAMVSAMFQTMFYGSFPQTESPIKIPDVTPSAFYLMLRYAYGEIIRTDDVGDLEQAMDSLYCAKKYLIDKLADVCRDHIQCLITTYEVDPCVAFQRAPQMDEENLTALALARIALNTSEVMQGDGFLRLSVDCLQKIVGYPHLNADELVIYQGVHRWVEHNVEAVQGHTFRDAFGSLLYSIRCSLFAPFKLPDGPVTDGMLSVEEASGISQFLLADMTPVLPFLIAPCCPLPAPLTCTFTSDNLKEMLDFERLNGFAVDEEDYDYETERLMMEARPDLAPECCAFLRYFVEANLHIRITFDMLWPKTYYCNIPPDSAALFSAAVADESNVLSHSIKGACWFEWDVKKGAACDFRIGVGRKPHLYHSAVFGFLLGLYDEDEWVAFDLWDGKRIKDVANSFMHLSRMT